MVYRVLVKNSSELGPAAVPFTKGLSSSDVRLCARLITTGDFTRCDLYNSDVR